MGLQDYVHIGKVTKPHGIKGEVKIYPFSEDAANFTFFSHLILVDSQSLDQQKYRINKNRTQGKIAVVHLDQVDTRNGAEDLVGRQVWVREDELPELDEDEFYWHKMVGMRVVLENRRELGTIRALLAAGGHDILIIRGRGREYMIPARREFLLEIDEDGQTIVVDPPLGLLEINQ